MTKRMRVALGGVLLLGAAVGSAVFARTTVFAGDDDGESPITGTALSRASAVALAHTGGGVVTETEVDDEDSYYEIEVTLDDGTQIDVQLDENFNVLSAESDEDEEDDDDDD